MKKIEKFIEKELWPKDKLNQVINNCEFEESDIENNYFGILVDEINSVYPYISSDSFDLEFLYSVQKIHKFDEPIPFIFKLLPNGNIQDILTQKEFILNQCYGSSLDLNFKCNNLVEQYQLAEKRQIKKEPILILSYDNIKKYSSGRFFPLTPNFKKLYATMVHEREEEICKAVSEAEFSALEMCKQSLKDARQMFQEVAYADNFIYDLENKVKNKVK